MNFKPIVAGLLAMVCASAPMLAQIQPGGAIQITVSGVPAEEKTRFDPVYPVSESGLINMPFIGQVRAAGMKADELATSLQARYKSAGIYTNPTFQVFDSDAQKITQQVVHLGGYVRKTGPVSWSRTLTLYQAIQAAGGANEFGSMKRVKLYRGGKLKEYNLTQSQFMNIPLEVGDTIEIPQKTITGN
jgi:polysaccharide export outer membrane protein